jgi:hypothetical protein
VSEQKQKYYNPADYTSVHNTHLKRLQVAGTSAELERLRRVERAARDVIASGENTCGEGRTLADLDKFRLAMEALRSALDSP